MVEYKKAPIKEAIIDIQVQRKPELDLSSLEQLADSLSSQYPNRRDSKVFEGFVEFGPSAPIQARSNELHDGFILADQDEKWIVQLKFNGFTLSRLSPYTNWDEFRGEARRLWELYRAACEPISVSRVAVRFINQLDVPLPVRDLRDFLRTYPELSSDMDPQISGFFMQLQCPQDNNATAVITQGLITPAMPNVVSILLDIDMFAATEIPTEDEELWKLFDDFRQRKNAIFEASITQRMRRQFD